MKRKYTMNSVLRGENNELSTNNQRTSFTRTWNNFFSGIYLPNMWPANNPLSVTIVNNEILNSGLSEHLSTKNKDLSYILQEEKLLCDLKQKNSKDYTYNECMFSVSILEHASKYHLQDWPCNNVDNPNLIKNRNYVNLIKNFDDTYKDNSTTESHSMLHVNEKEKTTEDIMTDVSGPSDVDPQKREIGIHEDTDVESFLVVAHSDVPATLPSFVKENPMSRLSNVCRNVWDSFTSRLYCKTMSADSGMSVKRLSYSTKQHHRRKANAIAIGRGRGRAKGQLRRSGVSQTVCRKECIKCDDYEIWPNDFIDTANDCPLDNKRDNLNKGIPDTTQFMKQINSPHTVISNFPKTTPAKRKPKARKKKKIKARYMTKVRYIADPSKMNDYYEDSNSEMHDVREDSSRSRLLSESSIDSEDSFVVFENDELPETCEKQGAIEHPTEARNVPDSSMSANDNPYDDSDSETYDFQKDTFQLRLLSESSDDCTDNFIIFDEQEATQYPEMRYDCLTKINDKRREDCNSQMQKNLFQRYRLPSDSSQNTDDSFSIVFTDIEENCAIDDVDGDEIEEMSSYDGDSQPENESISEDDQESEELIAQTKKVIKDLQYLCHLS